MKDLSQLNIGFWLLAIIVVVSSVVVELNGNKNAFLLTLFAILIFMILYFVFFKEGANELRKKR